MISCLVLANVRIYCIVTFYCFLPSFLEIHNSYLFSCPHFTFISGEEPYHGCADIKPLLLLLLLLLLSKLDVQCLGTMRPLNARDVRLEENEISA